MNRDRIALDVERPRGDQGKVVSMGRKARILVAHEQTLFRHVLEHALARHEDLHVVANAGTARHAMRAAIRNHTAMRAAIRNHPDVAVVSARLFAGAAGSITRIARDCRAAASLFCSTQRTRTPPSESRLPGVGRS